jgi:hypothetical protein
MAAANKDPQLARASLWQAAEMYEKTGARAPAGRAYERYVKQYPDPLAPALEARYRLARIAREDGNAARELALMKEVQRADLTAGAARTDRTRYLGGMATLALAKPLADDYRKVALVEPLKRQLKLKKDKMELALKAYATAADYGVAEVSTAATFQTAELYRDFGKALMTSQRPKGLNKLALEQYNVLLEEQAFPFEEKIEVHEVSAKRTNGIYDTSVRDSITALASCPARYGRSARERTVVRFVERVAVAGPRRSCACRLLDVFGQAALGRPVPRDAGGQPRRSPPPAEAQPNWRPSARPFSALSTTLAGPGGGTERNAASLLTKSIRAGGPMPTSA